VLNICEHGLAMRVVNALADDEFTELRFQVCQSTDWVETRGRIAWVDDPRTTVGVEFVDLPSEGRNVLEKWISSIRDLDGNARETESATKAEKTEPAAVALEASVETPSPEVEREEPLAQQRQEALARPVVPGSPGRVATPTSSSPRTMAGSGAERHAGSLQSSPSVAASLGVLEASPEEFSFRTERRRRQPSDRKWTVLIVGLAIVVLVLEGLYGLAQYRRSHDSVVQGNRNTAAPVSTGPEARKPSSPSPATSPASAAGFVVQAGAMAERDDAVALADSLQQKGFPSFVFKRDSSRLYEVVVGPYPTADAADRVRKVLEGQGAATFVRSWPLR
jgi:cell division septation protein DedD